MDGGRSCESDRVSACIRMGTVHVCTSRIAITAMTIERGVNLLGVPLIGSLICLIVT